MKKEIKFYYVYLITNKVLNKQYVGSRICYKDDINEDNYWGSSKYLDEDYIIYGIKNFTKEIIKDDYNNVQDMLEGETEYILKYNTLNPNGYNRFLPNKRNGFYGCNIIKHSDKSKLKMSISHTGKHWKLSDEIKKKWSKSRKGLTHLQRFINAYGEKQGIIKYENFIEKRKELSKGEKNPMFGKSLYNLWIDKYGLEIANIKQENVNKKYSKSSKEKNGMAGKYHSEETKLKMRNARINYLNKNS